MILTRRSKVGQEALRMYTAAQKFNRAADNEQLVPHIAAMREALGRTKRTDAETPAPDTGSNTGGSNTGGSNTGNGNGNGGGK